MSRWYAVLLRPSWGILRKRWQPGVDDPEIKQLIQDKVDVFWKALDLRGEKKGEVISRTLHIRRIYWTLLTDYCAVHRETGAENVVLHHQSGMSTMHVLYLHALTLFLQRRRRFLGNNGKWLLQAMMFLTLKQPHRTIKVVIQQPTSERGSSFSPDLYNVSLQINRAVQKGKNSTRISLPPSPKLYGQS